jgi:Flp pilus assembly protein TadG
MVEFALVLPVLLLVLLAILRFGLLFENYLTLTDAVRTGVRTLAIGRGTANACTGANGANMALQNASGSLKVASLTIDGGTPGGAATAGNPTFTSPDSCTSLTSGNAVTMSATYPCNLSIMGINFAPTCNLNVSATERVE